MKKNKVLLWLVISLVSFGCGKKKNPKPIDADVKKYFSYKPGTYWVYRDSISGQEDSFEVWRSLTTVSSDASDYDYLVEMAETYGYKNGTIDSMDITFHLRENAIDFSYYQYYSKSFQPLFTYPFPSAGNYADENGPFTVEVIPTFALQGQVYSNVLKLIRKNDIFYISTEVGLIKFKLNDSHLNVNWELLTYNIIH